LRAWRTVASALPRFVLVLAASRSGWRTEELVRRDDADSSAESNADAAIRSIGWVETKEYLFTGLRPVREREI